VLRALIARHPVWEGASDAALKALSSAARLVALRPGQVAVREKEPATEIHLLVEGIARVYYPGTRTRPQLTVKLLAAPAAFGDIACAVESRYTANVEALSDARIVAIDSRTYFAVLGREPSACFRQYLDLARRFAGAVQIEKSSVSPSAAERVVALLLAYAHQLGTPEDGGILIERALTQDEIAEQTASNRRTVVRVLSALFASGALERRGRKLLIADRARLVEVAGAELPVLTHQTRRS
jgi:CRP-like cAMP-binding protein